MTFKWVKIGNLHDTDLKFCAHVHQRVCFHLCFVLFKKSEKWKLLTFFVDYFSYFSKFPKFRNLIGTFVRHLLLKTSWFCLENCLVDGVSGKSLFLRKLGKHSVTLTSFTPTYQSWQAFRQSGCVALIIESVLKIWRRSVRNLRDIAEKQDGSGSRGGWCGGKNHLVSRGLIKLAYLFVARPLFWAYASLQTASCWHLSHAELGTTQLHLKRTDSPRESLGSMHLMPQVAFPGTESVQFMTYLSPFALTKIERIQLMSEAKNIRFSIDSWFNSELCTLK